MLLQDIEETIKRRQTSMAYVHSGEHMSYAELDRRARDTADALVHEGLKPGGRVGINLEACLAYPAICLGIWRAGGVVVPLDPAVDKSELSYFLDVAQAQFLIAAQPDTPISSGTGRHGIRPVPTHHRARRETDDSRDEDMLVLFTSGTTGLPKGIIHTRDGLEALIRRHVSYSGLTSDDVVLATSLFNTGLGFHSYILEPLLTGAKVVIVHPFIPRVALETAHDEKVTWIQTVPAVLKLLTAVRPRPPLPDLKTVRLGAATLDDASREEFHANFGIIPVQGYGMNELGRIAATRSNEAGPSGRTVGQPEVEVTIFGDDGQTVPAGELGEIGVRSPSLCRPFYLTQDGSQDPLSMRADYFLTGDLGRLSESGVLELAGRRKTFILTPRYKVDPHEVEEVLVQHPLVLEAAVLPEPGRAGYEAVKAVVVASNPVSVSELLSFCGTHLPAGKCPQSIVFVNRLPRNSLGKVELGKLQHS